MCCLTLVFLHACKLQTIDPETVDLGYDYYPLEVGRYIIYDEHDIVYNSVTTVDTIYNVKELIHESYLEGTENKFVIYHYAKKTTDADWPIQPDSVWTVVNTTNQLIRTESNVDYIKLVFPVKEGKTWNGNAKNTMGEITSSDKFYKMTNLNQPYTAPNGMVYDKTLKMTIANQSDPIVSMDIRYDLYARGIGFIKKDHTTYYYKQDSSYPPQTIDFGSHKVMEITSYGKE
ncbi:MAG: hypothetical protein JWM14_1840 [Chitinophagaceae bacterium]|nr:hypothetical protein [Chitinophagaceae bacterium]